MYIRIHNALTRISLTYTSINKGILSSHQNIKMHFPEALLPAPLRQRTIDERSTLRRCTQTSGSWLYGVLSAQLSSLCSSAHFKT
jgi:hypothetical protein